VVFSEELNAVYDTVDQAGQPFKPTQLWAATDDNLATVG
jgi:hypothetical protein